MNFSIEESKENDSSSNRKHQNADNWKPFIFTNRTGNKNKAPILGLAKTIYYFLKFLHGIVNSVHSN